MATLDFLRSRTKFRTPVQEINMESTLVARARNRDHQAFEHLVNQYERKIYRLAKRITQNDQDAEDVLQDTLMKAYEHLDRFHGYSKFYTWLVRIATNEALMKLRKHRNYRCVSLDEPLQSLDQMVKREIAVWDGNPEQKYSQSELYRIVEQALKSLRPKCRAVFILRDLEELSIEETAASLRISIAATKSRLLRARLTLREKLTRHFRSCRIEVSSFAEDLVVAQPMDKVA